MSAFHRARAPGVSSPLLGGGRRGGGHRSSAQEVRELIRHMPEDRIILETDCPYLAPVPLRGAMRHWPELGASVIFSEAGWT